MSCCLSFFKTDRNIIKVLITFKIYEDVYTKRGSNMPEKLNTKVVSFSLAIISGIVYILCAIFFAIAPQGTLNVFKYIFHGIDITKIAGTPVSFGNTLIGFVGIILFSLIIGWLFATIYNYLLNKLNRGKQ